MPDWQLKTPVALFVFNRPDATARVFAEIARAKPPRLLVVADGPRPECPGEAERCAATRAIVERPDWDCVVSTNGSDDNMGCRNRIASGVDWVFQQVPEAILLEDDCLPHPTFFRFCEELLNRYRDDERIAMISGDNFQGGRRRGEASYYFSRYNHIWGWASWRRAWLHYDRHARMWPTFRDHGWLDVLIKTPSERDFWATMFQSVYDGTLDTWDFQWVLATWAQGMVSVIPSVNLISNIGFGSHATHTRGVTPCADLPTEPMIFPLLHPELCLPDAEADAYTARQMFTQSLTRRVVQRLRRLFSRR